MKDALRSELESLRDLDFDAEGLSEVETQKLALTLLKSNGGSMERDELNRQLDVVGKLAAQTKFNVNAFRLIFKGLMDVTVDREGEIHFSLSDRARKAQEH